MTKNPDTSRTLSALLMVGASSLALATPAQANDYLFTSEKGPLQVGERQTQTETLTQISLSGGGTASFTDAAEYQINEDGSIELYQGSVTIAGTGDAPVMVRMPDGLQGEVRGRGSAANFSVQPNGEASGHVLTGELRAGRGRRLRRFGSGDMWAAGPGERPERVVANEAQSAPSVADMAVQEPQVVAISEEAGPVAAAANGIPVTLGDALAAAGASSDILGAARRVEQAVGNPALDTFPSGDLVLLIDRAAQIEFANGGSPFPAAQADIIRTYLRFLADGGSGAQFLTSFGAFSLDYLDLIRVGGVPSSFADAGFADINAYLAFIDRTGALAQLDAQDRVLAQAYLGFLRDGGNPDLFAATFTDLTDAYFAFVRAGGAPDDFQGASADVLGQTIAFLADSGLVAQLSAADQALVSAFLANGGLAFTGQFQAALSDYFAFLSAGGLPSAYEPVDQASLRQFLETLADTGLLNAVLGDQAAFYADYLAFLRSGGDVDGFAGLPVNIFTDYAAQLAAYRAFLDGGNLPSAFATGDPAQLQAFIAELQAAGALERFVGADADFFAAFAAFVANGGAFDAFGGLNANIFAGYALDLQAYFAFLEAGGVPSTYEPLSQAVIAQYIADLEAAGATARFLPELFEFYSAYFAFLAEGGNPDNFAGLPVPPDFGAFAAALNAYADFLAGGGFPADFDANDLSVLASFIEALGDAGELDARLGANADLLEAFFAFIANGGAPNQFAGLPIYADYVSALNDYFAFLAGGGFPQDYTLLDQATLNAFLAALRDAQGGLGGFEGLNTFFADYAAFVLGGGDPTAFAGLPIYAQYVADLNAYFAFLAGGGLPEDYTVIDAATLTAYLEALAGAQGGLSGFGDLDAFFEAYAAFVLGGGDPTTFAGLPVFEQYIADLNAYFAFLAAGGLPSEYTVLSQDILNAYLELLANAQGGLAGFAGLDDFFIDFFAFLQGGGMADDFADLPVNANRPRNALEGINGWQFASDGLRIANVNAEIDDDGRITSLTVFNPSARTTDYSTRDDDLREFGRIGNDVAWTRYLVGARAGGVTNGNDHLLVGTPATNLPTNGVVEYSLVGGTAPTNNRDLADSQAFFTGDLSVGFGSAAMVGLNFDILTRTEGYRVSTAGGAADPTNGGIIVAGNGRFEDNFLGITALTDTTCTGFCQAQVFGGLFGDGASSAGFTFNVADRGANNFVQGVAVFAQTGDAIASLGTQPEPVDTTPTGTGTPLILDFANEFAATSGVEYNVSAAAFSLSGFDLPTFTLAANGALTATQDGVNTRGIGTATATDISGNSRFLIGRWADGEYESTSNSEDTALTSAQGFHYLLAGPTTGDFALPTMGSIEYELIAATAPTIQDGSLAPGQFEADMIVLFGTTPTVAMEGSITLPTSGDDYVYSFASTGGIANPDQSDNEFRVRFGRNINFEFLADQITTSDSSCDETCTIQFAGYFAGEDALELGLTYTAQTGTIGRSINGAAIFGNGVLDDGSSGGGDNGGPSVSPFAGTVPGLEVLRTQFGLPSSTLENYLGSTVTFDSDGDIETFTSRNGSQAGSGVGPINPGEETGNTGSVAWARFLDPNNNQGEVNDTGIHVIVGTPAVDLPTSGLVNYALIGGTRPTTNEGTEPAGSFAGDLAIDFASMMVGIDFDIFIGDFGWNMATAGGAADPTNGGMDVRSIGQSFFGNGFALTPLTEASCTTTCSGDLLGNLYGDGASHAGVVYRVVDGSLNARGSAIFGAPSAAGTQIDSVGTLPTGNGSGGMAVAGGVEDFDTSVLVTAAISYGEEGFTRTSRTNQTEVSADGVLNSIGSFGRGDAVGDQIIGDEYAIIGRWIDGDIVFPTGARSYTTTADDASHWAIVSVVDRDFTLSGQITYDLLGATTPTYSNGRTAPGTFDGSLAINWLSPTQIALDFAGEVTMPDAVYAWSFQSGNFFPRLQGVFESNATVDGAACANNGCQAAVSYQFGGANLGERFAINYNISLFADDLDIGGSALFGAPGSFDPANYPNTASDSGTSAAPERSLANIVPAVAPLAKGDWARWGGAAGASVQGSGLPQVTDLLPPGVQAVEGQSFTPARSREAAIRQAERIMGGAISFARPGAGALE